MNTSIRFTSLKELMADVNLNRYTITSNNQSMNLWCDACGCINIGAGHVRLSTFIKECEGHERIVHG